MTLVFNSQIVKVIHLRDKISRDMEIQMKHILSFLSLKRTWVVYHSRNLSISKQYQ